MLSKSELETILFRLLIESRIKKYLVIRFPYDDKKELLPFLFGVLWNRG